MEGKRPLQELADARLASEFRQPLKTVDEACEAIGWEFAEKPVCCGQEVEMHSFITPEAYYAACRQCGRFIFDVTGPEWGRSAVSLPDADVYDIETEKRWVSGIAHEEASCES